MQRCPVCAIRSGKSVYDVAVRITPDMRPHIVHCPDCKQSYTIWETPDERNQRLSELQQADAPTA